MINPIYVIALTATITTVSSCSNQQLYEASRQHQLSECAKLVDSARLRCEAHHQQSYREYIDTKTASESK